MTEKSFVFAIALVALVGLLFQVSAQEDLHGGVYIISDITVSKDAEYQRYRAAVKPAIEGCGATYVVRAGAKFVNDNPTTAIVGNIGDWNPDRIVVLRFDSVEHLEACFDSPEYKAAYELQEGGSSARSVIVYAAQPDA